MKRIGNLYEQIYDVENVKLAIKNASKGKHDRPYVRRVVKNVDKYAVIISEMLRKREFVCGTNRTRTIIDGSCRKTREITVPQFYPDQIVHWAIIQVLEPIVMKGMYRYSCGSVPGRGGTDAMRYVRRVYHKRKARYVLKMDVHKFFPSIRHDKLKALLRHKIKDKETLELLDKIIDSGGNGLPIGFYTSQWLSNFYLEEADRYIKEVLQIRYYVRYVDDMVLIDSNKRKLHRAKRQLEEWLRSEGYGLEIKGDWQLWKMGSRPLDFVGFRFYSDHIHMRKRLFYHLTKVTRDIKTKGLNINRARRYISLIGWGKRINFRKYYLQKLKPVLSKGAAKRYISRYTLKTTRKREIRCGDL